MLGALVGSALVFLPWVPTFIYQARHTGTPWAPPPSAADLVEVFDDYAGTGAWAVLLAFFYFCLFALGVFGRRPPGADGLDLRDSGDDRSGPRERVGGDAPSGPGGRRSSGAPGSGGVEDSDAAGGLEGIGDLDTLPTSVTIRQRVVRIADRLVGFAGFGPGGAGSPERSSSEGVVLVLAPNRRAMPLLAVFLGTLLLALAGGIIDDAAFVARYTAAVLPLFLLIVALGLDLLTRRRLVNGALALVCVAGLVTAVGNNSQPRTQAVQIAQVLNAEAQPGDLVVYCPDQLGPAVSRVLQGRFDEITFPRDARPEIVDWVNYLKVVGAASPRKFVKRVESLAGTGGSVFYVWAPGYNGYGSKCQTILHDLISWPAHRYKVVLETLKSDTPFEIYEGSTLDSFTPR